MSENKLNIAVIGCGVGKLHVDGMVKKGVQPYAICDPDPERLEACKNEYNVSIAVSDYKELVNDPNVNAVVIASPDQIHLEQVEAFLRAGKDVMCEKPMALNLEDCEKMMQIEKETGRILMIGQVCRFTPSFALAKKLITEGRIGELTFIESEYAHNYANARGHNDWRMVPERHGFIGGGCHAVDLLRWLAGDPIEVYAYENHKSLMDWPTADTAIAIYKFPNDVMGKVFVSTGCKRNYTMRSVFYGTKGTIICDNTSETISLFEETEGDLKSFTKAQELPVEVNNHNFGAEIEMFINALKNGEGSPVPSMEGASTVAVCCATVESARDHKVVQIRYPKA